MRKLFAVLFAIALITSGGQALACEGPSCFSSGNFDTSVFAIGGAFDADFTSIPNGLSSGVSSAGGVGAGSTWGVIGDGTVGGSSSITAGGVTVTDSYRLNRSDVNDLLGKSVDKAIGVGTRNDSVAVLDGSISVEIDPNAIGWARKGGMAVGHMSGSVEQSTMAFSKVSESPIFFSTEGSTRGIANQYAGGVIIS